MKFAKTIFLHLIFILFFHHNLLAQELQEKFHDWSVFKVDRGDKIVCYTVSTPINKSGAFRKGEPFFLVTAIQNEADEISVSSGFIYDSSTDVELSFKSKKFYLFPYLSLAWANDQNEDIDVIKEMQKYDDFIVRGADSKGNMTVDTYSLVGFSKSYFKMKDICK